MKIGDKVFSVKGRRHLTRKGWGKGFDALARKAGGPFSGRIVRFSGCGGITACPRNLDCDHGQHGFCHAVIEKADGRKVRVRIANLRPWDAREFKKVRAQWER